jgi:hypothetical protein
VVLEHEEKGKTQSGQCIFHHQKRLVTMAQHIPHHWVDFFAVDTEKLDGEHPVNNGQTQYRDDQGQHERVEAIEKVRAIQIRSAARSGAAASEPESIPR